MNKFMQMAIEEARLGINSGHGGPFGCVIVKDGKVIGRGHNKVLLLNDSTSHGEVTAIRDACNNINSYDLSGCELYTSCYPCPMCLSAIIWSNIKTVYYANTKEDADDIGFRDEFIYDFLEKLSKNEKDDKVLSLTSLDREEAIKVFEQYKNQVDKIEY